MKFNQENNITHSTHVFPPDFLWGASTSHFQIEGNPFEITNRLSDWSIWTQDPSHIADQSSADQSCEFYQRFYSDLDFLSQLNLNAFRISLNWAAICPEPRAANGEIKINQEMIHFYRQVLQKVKEKNIKTFVTLFHFCLPQWLAETGGWSNERTIFEFGKFAQLACQQLGDLVDFWQTMNEPMVYVYRGYISASWPPGLHSQYLLSFHIIRNLLIGHAAAYQAIHAVQKQSQVSYTMHWQLFTPRQPLNPLDIFITRNRNMIFNHMFPQAIQTGILQVPFPFNLFKGFSEIKGTIADLKDSADYLAINYYTRDVCQFSFQHPFFPFGVRSDRHISHANALDWEIYPDGLYELLTVDSVPYQKNSLGKNMPIYITENGYASAFPAHLSINEGDWSIKDKDRCDFLQAHLLSSHKAIKAGVNIKGYLHWSLLDNFEWAEGLRIRFGLIRIAYPGQERTLRDSARLYAQIARSNSLINQDYNHEP